MSKKPLRFVTLPISHYCEKVRWAMERQGVPFVEDGHGPILHAFQTMPLTGGQSRTVPILVDDNVSPRKILSDSTDCLRYLADHYGATWLYAPSDAAEIEDELDRKLGPATRRFAYYYLLPEPATISVLTQHVPAWEATVAKAMFPLIRRAMAKAMRISPEGAERSLSELRQLMSKYSERLSDGRRYLCGDTLSAADITLATLAAPVIFPPGYAKITMPDLSVVPGPLREEIIRQRQSLAGQFVLRLYTEDRTKTIRSA